MDGKRPFPSGVEPRCQAGQLVAEGDILASAASPEAGTNPKSGTAATKQLKLCAGANTELRSAPPALVARAYGIVTREGQRIGVRPPVVISEDKLTATIDIVATSSGGQQVTKEMIRRSLAAAEVRFGIDEAKISEGLATARRSDSRQSAVKVAFGTAAVAGRESGLELTFKISGRGAPPAQHEPASHEHPPAGRTLDLVCEGDVLCRKIPRIAPQRGKNVRGEAIEPLGPKKEGAPLQLKCGKNVRLAEDGECYVSTAPVCGYVDVQDGVLAVVSPITVVEDHLSVHLTVYPADSKGALLERRDVHRLLEIEQITSGIDARAIEQAISAAQATGQAQMDVLIASGVAAVNGEDAQLELCVDLEKKAGAAREGGAIDFRERGWVFGVKAGSLICERIPPALGRAGVDVYGRVILPAAGRDLTFKPGKGVTSADDGRSFSASTDGVVVVANNTVGVYQLVELPGDVDFSTGNIRAKDSVVRVAGTVRSGFTIHAASLIVRESVEDAEIDVLNSVEVSGGIVHGDRGRIRAGGSVSGTFAQNARIEAKETITIRSSALGCNLLAKRIVLSGGKGCLVGGLANAEELVDVKELGSRAAVSTMVVIERATEETQALDRQIAEQDEAIARIDATIGEEVSVQRKTAVRPARRSVIEKLDRQRERARRALSKLLDHRRVLFEKGWAAGTGEVLVRTVAFPGAVVRIHGVLHTFDEEHPRCRLRLDETKAKLVVLPV